MTGMVTADREAVIDLRIRGSGDQEIQVEAVIDTGFTGFLTLPKRLIDHLALAFMGPTRAVLADGHEVSLDVFEAAVIWDDQEKSVPALAAEGSILVGMAMLAGYRVTLEMEDNGVVMIESLA